MMDIYLMDELNIHFRENNKNLEFKLEHLHNVEVFYAITEGNPGTTAIMLEIYRTQQGEDILVFLNKIWKQRITGDRLWYIYKNECNSNIKDLLSKDLTPFINEYFHNKC